MMGFTKDELEQIRDDLDHDMSMYVVANNSFNRNMRDKTQRMIDRLSECNHKEIVSGAYPRNNPPMKCEKCGKLYR